MVEQALLKALFGEIRSYYLVFWLAAVLEAFLEGIFFPYCGILAAEFGLF